MRRRVSIGPFLLAAVLAQADIAQAEDARDGGARVEDGTPVAQVSSRGRSGGNGGGGGGSAPVCSYNLLPEDSRVYEPDGSEIVHATPGSWYTVDCDGGLAAGGAGYVFISEAVDPEVLAAQAKRALPLVTPDVQTSPSTEDDQLVGVPSWLWVGDAWAPMSATAALPGVSVTVTATPESVAWDMGNGDVVVCAGPGTAYDPSRRDEDQSTDCSYTYRRSSASQPGQRYQVTATTTWQVSWSASGVAGGGSLGTVSRSTTFGLRVTEAQALNQ